MNENINLVDILKDAPTGTKLYSPLFGEILLSSIMNDEIICHIGDEMYFQGWEKIAAFNKYGQLLLYPITSSNPTREVMVFPSENSRDWSTFKAPWKHRHFEPFQKVLIVTNGVWQAGIYSHYRDGWHYLVGRAAKEDSNILPYEGNEDKLGKPVNKLRN